MKSIRYISDLMWQARRTYFIVFLFLLLESVSSYTLIYIQKMLIDDVFYAGNYDLLPVIIGVFAVAGTVYALMFTMTSRYLVTSEFVVSGILLKRMLGALEKMKVSAFSRDRHGKYVHTLTSDLFFGSSFIGWQMPRGIQEVMNLVILIAIVGWASPILLLLILVLCAFYLTVAWYFMPKLRKSNDEVSDKQSELLVQMEEGVASTREVIAYHRIKWEEALFHSKFAQYFAKAMSHGKLENRQLRWSDPMKWGVGIVVLAYGGYSLIQGHMSVGTFVIVLQFATLMSDSFYNFFQFLLAVSGNLAHHDRMRSIVGIERQSSAEIPLVDPIKIIKFDKVVFRYESELPAILQEFSAVLPAAQKIGIVGKSGSGKSTLAQLLTRFYDMEASEILVNEVPLQKVSREDWAKYTAVVFQDPYLFPGTIRENILLGRSNLTEDDLIEACKIAQIHSFICELPEAYETQIGERGIKLSGGQRQRIAIARAIVGNPEILVLDEATSALDLETERQLLGQLDAQRKGKTTILIAHRLSTIENSDLILIVDNGTLVDSGTNAELLALNPVYQELQMAQQN
ncbi:ABC transporter ATP-binding protein [Bacillus alkalicellulosilyticus]|uniref:ABC transporter ATP-binding protein n=1 Tax=Alkalihalobacterium alkalicellulosilyticum TaxID=1912214 RepID=UPI000996C08F|nr:ABC transporter ATP-binding protein [Bacillus alkalicellulosilyticus]